MQVKLYRHILNSRAITSLLSASGTSDGSCILTSITKLKKVWRVHVGLCSTIRESYKDLTAFKGYVVLPSHCSPLGARDRGAQRGLARSATCVLLAWKSRRRPCNRSDCCRPNCAGVQSPGHAAAEGRRRCRGGRAAGRPVPCRPCRRGAGGLGCVRLSRLTTQKQGAAFIRLGRARAAHNTLSVTPHQQAVAIASPLQPAASRTSAEA